MTENATHTTDFGPAGRLGYMLDGSYAAAM